MTLATFFLAFLALPSDDAKAATQPTIKEWPTNLRTDLKGTSLKLVLPENAVDKPWDDALIAKFGELTGITVQVVRPGNEMTAVLAGYLQGFENGSADGDVYAIDIVWPAIFSGYAEDLRAAAIGTQEMLPTLIQDDTIKGKLVAIPYFTEVSLLFYRRDLLSKYHFPRPPVTWNELEQQARAIQNGERSQGMKSFWGFLWQGAPSEALTCNAIEWQISQGAGPLIKPDGTLGIQQDQFVGALERARGWINTISPADVTSQLEDDSLRQWKQGEAAFMRNWPYAYPESMSPGSLVRNQVGVTVLPKGSGPGGRHSDVLGGFQLMVSKTSKNKSAAIELIKFLTSPEIQRVNAVTRGEFLRQLRFYHGLMRLNSGDAVLKGITFSDGTIEFDVNTIGRGAPGIAFRQQDEDNFELLYLRPDPACPAFHACIQYAPQTHGVLLWDLFPQYQTQTAAQFSSTALFYCTQRDHHFIVHKKW